MAETCMNFAAATNRGGAKTCTQAAANRTPSVLQRSISALIKLKNPRGAKPFAMLMGMFSIKERAAKHRLSNSVSYTIEELQTLIHGDDGYDYLEVLMSTATPQWWIEIQILSETLTLKAVAKAATQQSLQLEARLPVASPSRRKFKDLLNANISAAASAIARKEDAMGILDSFSHRAGGGAVVPAQAQATGTSRNAGGRGR